MVGLMGIISFRSRGARAAAERERALDRETELEEERRRNA
jgi:hypothetical protein